MYFASCGFELCLNLELVGPRDDNWNLNRKHLRAHSKYRCCHDSDGKANFQVTGSDATATDNCGGMTHGDDDSKPDSEATAAETFRPWPCCTFYSNTSRCFVAPTTQATSSCLPAAHWQHTASGSLSVPVLHWRSPPGLCCYRQSDSESAICALVG
jgi:hypothetical protein